MNRKCWVEAEAALAELIRFNRLSADSTIELIRMLALHDQSPIPFSDVISTGKLLDRMLAQVPDHSTEFIAQLRSTQAEHLAKSGQWARAAAAFEEAGRILPTDAWIRHRRFLALLSAGNREGLRREARHLLDRCRDTTDPWEANDAAWSLVLVPDLCVYPESLVSLTEIAAGNFDPPLGIGLSGRRHNRLGTDPNTRKLLEQLEEPIAMSFAEETPLEDVLRYVMQATKGPNDHGIHIYIDPVGLAESEKTMVSPVKINLQGVPLKTTLRLVLKQLGLTYVVKDRFLLICFDKPGNSPTEIHKDPVANQHASLPPRGQSRKGRATAHALWARGTLERARTRSTQPSFTELEDSNMRLAGWDKRTGQGEMILLAGPSSQWCTTAWAIPRRRANGSTSYGAASRARTPTSSGTNWKSASSEARPKQ